MNKKMKQKIKQNMKQKLTVRMKERLKEKKNMKKTKWIIDSLSKKYKAIVFSFLRYIRRNYNMKWEPNGTFKYKNKIIPNPNILHLILHALLNNVKAEPPGMKEFYQGLTHINVPEYLISNTKGRELILGLGEDEDWGPSGGLANRKTRKKQKWNK